MALRHSWSLDWLDLFSCLLFDCWFMDMPSYRLEQGGGEGNGEVESRRPNEDGYARRGRPSAISEQWKKVAYTTSDDLIV